MANLSAIKLPSGTTYTLKDTAGRKEAYLEWGGKNITGDITPVGMSISMEHSANRIAFLNPAAIQIEYTTNGGSTWTDSGYNDTEKMWLCTNNQGIAIGQSRAAYSASTALTTNHWTRVTLTGQNGTTGYVYTSPRKLLINMSTALGVDCLIEYKTGVSGANWQTFGTYAVSGWSGWNDIPLILGTFGGGSTQTGNNWYLRFTFKITSTRTDNYKGMALIYGLRLFGTSDWGSASSNNSKGPISSTGHLYSYDTSANATFPAKVTANGGFSGNLTGNVTGNVSGSAGSVAWSGVSSKPTTLSGYGITDAKIANGVITLGSNTITPLTSHQDISGKADKSATVSNVAYDSTNAKITKTINGTTSDVVTVATLKTALGSMPASDVYSWAKASTKPSYAYSEITGTVPSSALPSYVDDVLEYTAKANFPTTGETGKIYVDTATNLTWRWGGSNYVEISPSLALGTTSSTAYRGDYGNTAYTHATDANRLTTAKTSGFYKIATTAHGHVQSVTAVAKSDITALGIPAQDTTYTLSGALASHKFTTTLTPSSGSATTSDFTLAAGTGITITDDTTNRKMTIACSVTNTDTKVTQAYSTMNTQYPLLMSATEGVTSTDSRGATTAIVNNQIYAQPGTGELTVTTLRVTGDQIVIKDSSGYSVGLTCALLSTNRAIEFPNKTGTIALTSDIPSIPTVPTITLNGTATTAASFYAPTSAGTSGYYLKSNGSGAPTWTAFPSIPSIPSNNVTGSGTSGQLAQWNGTNTLTSGPKITASTSTPSGGSNGDIWFVYS